MFMLPSFLRRHRERLWGQYMLRNDPIPWSETFKNPGAKPVLFDASTWDPYTLFDGEVSSPCRTWTYDEVVLPAANAQRLISSRGVTHWLFDGDIRVPRLVRGRTLWMSYTPNEVLTLRPGLRMAKGHVVIAGLGMGWLLSRVMAKKSVTRVSLVERDEALLEWLLPVVRRRHFDDVDKQFDVIVADAYEQIPRMKADVALWDIWENVGEVDNCDEADMHHACKGIDRTWFWAANARVPNSIW